jgi:D-glycero-D-manno-heptose 1,7-bisphosphate phosphatase
MIISVKAKAAFIDRDGVINEERNYVHSISDFVLLPGVIEGLKLLRDAGYRLIVITNQAGIARGYYTQAEMNRLHEYMRGLFAEHGVSIDAIYYCPHHPKGVVQEFAVECDCRKPSPGMLLQAAKDFDLNLNVSVLIGDKITDIQAGKRAGLGQTVIVQSGHKLEHEDTLEADAVELDLLAAARILTQNNSF